MININSPLNKKKNSPSQKEKKKKLIPKNKFFFTCPRVIVIPSCVYIYSGIITIKICPLITQLHRRVVQNNSFFFKYHFSEFIFCYFLQFLFRVKFKTLKFFYHFCMSDEDSTSIRYQCGTLSLSLVFNPVKYFRVYHPDILSRMHKHNCTCIYT